ncbi:MAG: hypothetical protein IPJ87_14950 [Flavobacteriales bacterium]|jgi:hypothetical protein|nr:hypothetical protein [Flavobacteriales bacterium]MBK7943147.1 hypothetical protein [Flavobacteriales bacterium]MBK8947353.1 hypothetical protein [Flavobacteriales bacterium]MBK9701800.1 hypothetical protein [Flavobacteriales bacterium]
MSLLRTLFPLSAALLTTSMSAQLAIGEWRDHFPYRQTLAVAEGEGKAWCATRNAVFAYHRPSGEIERFTKVNALSDVDVSVLNYNAAVGGLLVAYRNGNLDLIRGGTASNLSDIKRSNIIGDKGVYDIHFEGTLAYLACGFGIVVVDLEALEVRETWFIAPGGTQVKVNDVAFIGDSIYAATNTGLFAAYRFAPNLAAFTSWQQRTELPTPSGPFNAVVEVGGRVVVNYHNAGATDRDTVYFREAGVWQRLTHAFGRQNTSVRASSDGSMLLLCQNEAISRYDSVLSFVWLYNSYVDDLPMSAAMAIPSADGDGIWAADRAQGLVYLITGAPGAPLSPPGPSTVSALRMSSSKGGLYVATGGVQSNWTNQFRKEGVHQFFGGQWSTTDRFNDPLMATGANTYGGAVNDLMAVAADPEDADHAFVGSWDDGVLELRGGAVQTIHNADNSSLQVNPAFGADNGVQVAGLAFDAEGDLWATNSNCAAPISVRTAGGTWRSFAPGAVLNNNSLLSDILPARQNRLKWVIRPRSNGMLVFTDNGTLSDPGDDQYKVLTTAEGIGGLPSMDVFSMAEDLDGEVWVGTGKGVAVFYTPDAVFGGGDFDCQQILIEQGGNVQILLETESVSAIAVDGADRKWLGTLSSGVFLVSPDGTEQLHHFTAENSPLPSNTITSLAIDGESGEVFFGTDQGIVSYRGTATESGVTNACAKVFPNPVRETYTGPIAITGLVRDSDVKVTDVAGNLVYRTTSDGGQAIWPGTDMSGNRVSTGVYLVFASDADGNTKCNTKVLVVR